MFCIVFSLLSYFTDIPILNPMINIHAIKNRIIVFLKSNLASVPILSNIGTNMFIINMLINIPSGIGVKYLNIIVSIPKNIAYNICPIGVTGLVCCSEAINIDLNINPPVNIWNNGYHIPKSLIPPITYVIANIVIMYIVGILHFITLVIIKYASAKMDSAALIDPIISGMFPINIFKILPYGFTSVSYVPISFNILLFNKLLFTIISGEINFIRINIIK